MACTSSTIGAEHEGIHINNSNTVTDCTNKTYTEADKQDMVEREHFNQRLSEYYNRKPTKKPHTRSNLKLLLEELHVAKTKRFRKHRREYHILKTYDIGIFEGEEEVIRKSDLLPVIAFEDLYDTILKYHIITNHGGKTKLEAAFKQGGVNVPRPATEIFLLCCRKCCDRRNLPKKVLVQKPKYTKGFSHKGQIDVIDFSSTPHKNYNTVLAYQDHYTKFLILRPLGSDSPEAITTELLNIFMLFGAPKVLESYNGKYFVAKVVQNLNGIWSEDIIAHGEPKETENPSKTPDEIEVSIRLWMRANFSNDWVSGLSAVQWQANVCPNETIGRHPYEALFGVTPHLQLHPSKFTCFLRNSSKSKCDSAVNDNAEKNCCCEKRDFLIHSERVTETDESVFAIENLKENHFCRNEKLDIHSEEDIKPTIPVFVTEHPLVINSSDNRNLEMHFEKEIKPELPNLETDHPDKTNSCENNNFEIHSEMDIKPDLPACDTYDTVEPYSHENKNFDMTSEEDITLKMPVCEHQYNVNIFHEMLCQKCDTPISEVSFSTCEKCSVPYHKKCMNENRLDERDGKIHSICDGCSIWGEKRASLYKKIKLELG